MSNQTCVSFAIGDVVEASPRAARTSKFASGEMIVVTDVYWSSLNTLRYAVNGCGGYLPEFLQLVRRADAASVTYASTCRLDTGHVEEGDTLETRIRKTCCTQKDFL